MMYMIVTLMVDHLLYYKYNACSYVNINTNGLFLVEGLDVGVTVYAGVWVRLAESFCVPIGGA